MEVKVEEEEEEMMWKEGKLEDTEGRGSKSGVERERRSRDIEGAETEALQSRKAEMEMWKEEQEVVQREKEETSWLGQLTI